MNLTAREVLSRRASEKYLNELRKKERRYRKERARKNKEPTAKLKAAERSIPRFKDVPRKRDEIKAGGVERQEEEVLAVACGAPDLVTVQK